MLDTAYEGLQMAIERLGLLFYVLPPTKHSYANVNDVPDYYQIAVPVFFTLIFIEAVAGWFVHRRSVYRVNDLISSVTSGSSRLLISMFWDLHVEQLYIYIWNNYNIKRLPYDSWFTFFALLICVDFGYYWMHRFVHSIHLAWTGHATHHSGEDYTLASGLRQAGLQSAISFLFYLPLALFFPPSAYKVHAYANVMAQFWFHTNLIGKLGPLEYILNTPSHHRMHHRPPGNCNYGGFLIIFDRLFGTYVPEDQKEDYFGLADNLNTFDTVWANFFHFKRIFTRVEPHPRKWWFTPKWLSQGCRRRANHPITIDPLGPFKPIPALKNGQNSWDWPIESHRRPKWDGVVPLSTASTGWIAFNFAVTVMPVFFAVSTSKILVFPTMTPWIILTLMLMAMQGRTFDARPSIITPLMDVTRSVLVVFCCYSLSPILFMMRTLHGPNAERIVADVASIQPLAFLFDLPHGDESFTGMLANLHVHQLYAISYAFVAVYFAYRLQSDVFRAAKPKSL